MMSNWKTATTAMNVLVLTGSILYAGQHSRPTATVDSLKSVEVAVVLNSGGGSKAEPMFKMRSDGTFESMPASTTITVELKGVLNGKQATATLTGKFVALVEGIPIFRTPERLALVYYPSGRVLPCFTAASTGRLRPASDGKSDRFLQAWVTHEFRSMREQVRTLGERASKGEEVASRTLGYIVHPDSRRELVKLQASPDKGVSLSAKEALAVWRRMRMAALSVK